MGVQAATEIMNAGAAWDPARFMERFAPPALQTSYRDFLASFVELDADCILQDGYLHSMTAKLRQSLAARKREAAPPASKKKGGASASLHDKLRGSITRLDRVIRDYAAARLSPVEREFFDVNLLLQARLLRSLYQYLDELQQSVQDRGHLAGAERALAEALEIRKSAEQGKWSNWYRGDQKMNLTRWLEETRKLEGN